MPAGADLSLLTFILVFHALPLIGLAAGGAWGEGVVGYATAVVLLSGRELVRECSARIRAAPRSFSR
jgi:hypothetical protein